MGSARNRPEGGAGEDSEEAKLTDMEEREARDLAALFNTRWRETEDIGPLVEEFFAGGFAEYLRAEPQLLFFHELKPESLAWASRDDLERQYVASMNFTHLMFRLYEVYEVAGGSGEEKMELRLRDILPASVWNVLESNPTLYAIMREEMGEAEAKGQAEAIEPDTQQQQRRAEAKEVRTLEQVRSLTDTLERAVVLLRDHLKSLPGTLDTRERISSQQSSDADSSAEIDDDPLKPQLYISGEAADGYPAGTRMIYVDILPFRMRLVRAAEGERLKVASVYLMTD
jgi:hypothetical protein